MQNLEKLFNPSSIAIIGASPEEGKVGQVITKNILTLGYGGKVFLINPKHEEIIGQKCYPNLSDIKEKIDLAIVVIPAKFVNRIIKESADKIKNFVVISAGFAEVNSEGKEREKELAQIAKQYELNILGPNCLGFIVPSLKLNASFAGGMPEAGNIAFVSQSGALAVAIMDNARSEEIKFSSVISIGNKMSLDESDLLEYLNLDANTKLISMYLEGIKDGAKFIRTASKVSQRKPIVILKAGRSEKTQKAISSHTGALAGSDEIMDALFEKTGVLRANNFEEFYSLVNLISRTDAPANGKVAIITNAGGPGVLTADAFNGKEIKIGNLSDGTKDKLREFLPEEASVENPVDLLGDAMEGRYQKALEMISEEKEISTLAIVLTPQDQTPVKKIAQTIIDFKKGSGKNVITFFIGGDRVGEAISDLEKSGIPNFSYPEQGINALDQYFKWGKSRGRLQENEIKTNKARQKKAVEIIQKAQASGRGALLFQEAKEIMKLYGVRTIAAKKAGPKEKSGEDISFPAVIKVDSDKILHKTDKQALILDIKNEKELESAIEKIKKDFPEENIIIQPMLPRQTEIIIGVKNDPTVGPVVVYGLGGIYTEIFRRVNFLIPPVSPDGIKESLSNGNLGFLFKETRGQKPYNIQALAEVLRSISELSLEVGEIKELDINPLLIYNDGKEEIAVDIKVII